VEHRAKTAADETAAKLLGIFDARGTAAGRRELRGSKTCDIDIRKKAFF